MPMRSSFGRGAIRVRLLATTLAVLTLAAGAAAPSAASRAPMPDATGWGGTRVARALEAAPVPLDATARAGLRGLPSTARVAFHPATGRVRFLAGTRGAPLATATALRATARRLGLDRATAAGSTATPTATTAGATTARDATAAEIAARAYLAGVGPLFGVERLADLRADRIRRTSDGRSVVRYQQRRAGIPVIGGELIVQLDRRGAVTSVSGEALPATDRVATAPRLTAARARTIAADWLARDQATDPDGIATRSEGLAILDPRLLDASGPPIPRLVWRIDTVAPATAAHELVLVDARTGDVLDTLARQAAALERRICDFKNKRTRDFRCLASRTTRAEGDPPTGRQQVDALYRLLAQVWDYWNGRFGRDGLDGDGQGFVATVRYCEPGWCPMQNAFWEWGPQQAAFGDGWADVDDLVGHEFTHGVLDHEARLFYDYQSGALNESFADIFGEGFDLTNTWDNDGAGARWLIGEDLRIGTVRDMQDPGRFGDPDRVRSPRWWSTSGDSGGVHSNSGVGNKAAALIADGGRFNGFTVRGIGLGKMLAIEYEVITDRLTSAADYLDLHDALSQACTDLVGRRDITLGDCRSVRDAADATEMDLLPWSASPRQAPMCATGRYPVTAFEDDLENPTDGLWASRALNGGPNPWHYPPNPNGRPDWDGTWASSGRYNLFGADIGKVSSAVIEMTQPVTVPGGAYLRFEHGYRFDADSLARDGGVVEISVDGGRWRDLGPHFVNSGYTGTIAKGRGNPLRGRRAFVSVSRGWGASRVDLSDFAGHEVRIRFRLGSDDRHGSYGWYIDDVRIYRCAKDTAPPTGSVTIGSGNPLVRQRLQTLTIDGQDAGTAVTRMRVSNNDVRRGGKLRDGVELPFTTSLEWLLTDTAWGGRQRDGSKTVYVQLRDRAGNWSAPFSDRTLLDSGPPVVSAPVLRFVTGTSIAADEPRIPVRVGFSATDGGTGVTHTELERKRDDNDWTALDLGTATGTELALRLPDDASTTWRFRARADDDAGFTSDWSVSPALTLATSQEEAAGWTWTGGWATEPDPDAFGGAVRVATATTATGTLGVTGRRVALVAERGPGAGTARVLLDGVEVATVDLHAASVTRRAIVWTGPLTGTTQTLAIVVTGQKNGASSGTRVAIDAVITLR